MFLLDKKDGIDVIFFCDCKCFFVRNCNFEMFWILKDLRLCGLGVSARVSCVWVGRYGECFVYVDWAWRRALRVCGLGVSARVVCVGWAYRLAFRVCGSVLRRALGFWRGGVTATRTVCWCGRTLSLLCSALTCGCSRVRRT